jgi:acetyltransferase-like isoleucine patch superfamily enzyme
MAYYSQDQLNFMGFKRVGKHVKISDKASIYNCEEISIGDYSRVDDFCVVSGKVEIGRNVHIAPFCLVAGGEAGIFMEDFSGLAYHAQVFTQSDDYSGATMTNPTVPDNFKCEIKKNIRIGRHVIVGAGSVIFPGVHLQDGCSIGAMSLVRKSTLPWGIYVGNPAKRIKDRSQEVIRLEKEYLRGLGIDTF